MKLVLPKLTKFGLALLLIIFFATNLQAQTPQKFNYQAIIKDSNGQILANHTIGLQFSILSGSETGTAVYSEQQQVTTLSNGLITLAIGDGTVLSGSIEDIDWGENTYYLSVSIDINNTGSYTSLGVSQLLSVPYAMYAEKAKTADLPVINAEEGDILYYKGNKWIALQAGAEEAQLIIKDGVPSWKEKGHYVGELYGGGIVFHVWETNGVQHGLIASLANITPANTNSGYYQAPVPANAADSADYANLFAGASSHYNGPQNTANIATFLTNRGLSNFATHACDAYSGGGYTDWYLPALDELSILYRSLYAINPILESDGNTATTIVIGNYWSSTIFSIRQAFYWAMGRGNSTNNDLNGRYYVRPIRQF